MYIYSHNYFLLYLITPLRVLQVLLGQCDLRHIVRLRYAGSGKYFPNPLGKDPFERVFYSIYINIYGVAPFKTPLLYII
jgi:hypothetical protein